MEIYSTYVDAVIANGNTKGVYTTGRLWVGDDKLVGCFTFFDETETPITGVDGWVECNPADYLETLELFLASGKRLVDGDSYINLKGNIYVIGCDVDAEGVNCPSKIIDRRFYIIQAAANNTPDTWKPVVGDKVSTCEGIGKVLTTVVRDNLTAYIVQFENDWNEFDLTQLSPVDYDYENGKAVHELWYSCLFDESWYSCLFDELNNPDFNDLTVEARGRWIEFAKLVKRA